MSDEEEFQYMKEAVEPYITQIFDQNEENNVDVHIIEKNIPFLTESQMGTQTTKGSRYLNSQIMTGQISDFELRTFNLYALIHGEPDLECANYMKDNLKQTLQNFLPKECPPIFDPENMDNYHHEVRLSIAQVFFTLNMKFLKEFPNSISGCSLTVVVQYGWHFIFANVGDIRCVVDTSSGFATVTSSHKLGVNTTDTQRAIKAGARVAQFNKQKTGPADDAGEGCGSYRMWNDTNSQKFWPEITRGLGYSEFPAVTWHPSICHVEVSQANPTRILLGCGCWDWPNTNQWGKKMEDGKSIVKFVRAKNMEHACEGVVERSQSLSKNKEKYDCSALVIDAVPSQQMRFKKYHKQYKHKFCHTPKVITEFTQVQSPYLENKGDSSSSDNSSVQPIKIYKNPIIKIHCFDDSYRIFGEGSSSNQQDFSFTNVQSSQQDDEGDYYEEPQNPQYNPQYFIKSK